MSTPTRGSCAIVGAATAHLGEAPGFSHMEVMADAARAALADCGLTLADVDGLFCESLQAAFPAGHFAQYLGLTPSYIDSTNTGGSSVVFQMRTAAIALETGAIDVALICYGSNQRSASGKLTSPSQGEVFPYEHPYKPRPPIMGYAFATARHMHEFGTTRRQLAEVAVAARDWARLNPEAFMREPLTVDDVVKARMIADPMTVRDCCLVTDGGGAIVMTRSDRAKDLPRPPVHVLGVAGAQSHWHITMMPDLTTTCAVESANAAFAASGVKRSEVDVVQLYDAFTINTITLLEDMGFCQKGEGGAFVSEGRIAPGGEFPVNTYGGGLSCTHPGMLGMFVVVEAVRQLRGECGDRQVADCEVAVAHGNGGMFSSEATALLGTASTL